MQRGQMWSTLCILATNGQAPSSIGTDYVGALGLETHREKFAGAWPPRQPSSPRLHFASPAPQQARHVPTPPPPSQHVPPPCPLKSVWRRLGLSRREGEERGCGALRGGGGEGAGTWGKGWNGGRARVVQWEEVGTGVEHPPGRGEVGAFALLCRNQPWVLENKVRRSSGDLFTRGRGEGRRRSSWS